MLNAVTAVADRAGNKLVRLDNLCAEYDPASDGGVERIFKSVNDLSFENLLRVSDSGIRACKANGLAAACGKLI